MITVIPRKITATSVNGVAVANDGSITLPVDSAPTTNSTNLVTSGGVKTELDALSARIGNAENPAQVWTDVSFTIPTSSWSLSNNKYTATVQSSSILATSGVFVNYDNLDNAITPIIAEESTGQVAFTTETIPSGTITGTFRIIDSVNGIVPMERGGTGVAATSKDNLLTQLGAASTSALTTGLAGKQNTLTFDSTPTQNSTNPVTSGGVYAANNAQNTQIANLKSNAGIVEDGNTATHTISKGQYVIWKGVLYTADAAIASGTTLAASGGNKNLTAVPNGGLNALNSNLATESFSLTWLFDTSVLTGELQNCWYNPATKITHISFILYSNTGQIPSKSVHIASFPSKYKPNTVAAYTMVLVDSDGANSEWQPCKWERAQIENSSRIYINNFILGRDNSYLMYLSADYVAVGS